MDSAESLRVALSKCVLGGYCTSFLDQLDENEVARLSDDWVLWAREDQKPPLGSWTTWLLMGGRGAGKTRAGAEWVKAAALGRSPFFKKPVRRIALVGETFLDVREVMIEGFSGLLSVHLPEDRPSWKPSIRKLEWPNGAVAQVFSSEDPESLRGPQFELAWSDEIAKWRLGQQVWDMLQFTLRLGEKPRQIATTTPRPVTLIHNLLKDKNTVVTKLSTLSNRANLSPGFLDVVVGKYKGTKLGRQELEGELIVDRSDALFNRDEIDRMRITEVPDKLQSIVIAVDPPASSRTKASACGIVAVGLGKDGIAYVLRDASIVQARPIDWAKRTIALYYKLAADSIVVEVNQGGEMVDMIIHGIDANVRVRSVRASRSKLMRTEPVAALYEQGRVRHVGVLRELEDEMCDFGLNGLSSGRSPDRLDALVWGVSVLLSQPITFPKIRLL